MNSVAVHSRSRSPLSRFFDHAKKRIASRSKASTPPAEERVTFSLLVQRKSNQKESTPTVRAFRASCPPGARSHYGVRRQHIRVLTANSRASCARSPAGTFSFVRSPHPDGTRE